ncbi:hypothetical protein [Aureivirga sp. CE67]|uniref:hypothetical protein n=1 Tax=Aureivirga sp. CE67 TaxID=1788983 RepID=UPI0018CA7DF5|nr:hypothetical protein [Aureivirga sp. CE67]
MQKKLEAELMSIAHGILQMKNRDDVKALHEKAQALYEKLSVLKFLDYYQQTTPNATESKEELLEYFAKATENKESLDKAAEEEKILSGVKEVLTEEIRKINLQQKTEEKKEDIVDKQKLVSTVQEVIKEEIPRQEAVKVVEVEKEIAPEVVEEKVVEEKVVISQDEPTLIVKEVVGTLEEIEDEGDVFSKPISNLNTAKENKTTNAPVEEKKEEVVAEEKPKPMTEAERVREQIAAIKRQAEKQREDFEHGQNNPITHEEEQERLRLARIEEEKRQQQLELQRQEEYRRQEELKLQEEEAEIRRLQELKQKQLELQKQEELRKAQELKLQQEEAQRKAQLEQQVVEDYTLEEELRNTPSVDETSEMFNDPSKIPTGNSINDRFTGNTGGATVNALNNKVITVGLNDRIAFVKHLFENSQEDFNRVLSQLNTLKSEREAKYFITKMVKPDYNWTDKEDYEERLMKLIERRFV